MGSVTDIETTERASADDVASVSARARAIRLIIAASILALTLSGTVLANDYAFPFGPPRMYSTRADPDTPVSSTRVVGFNESGEEVRLSGGEVGLRRAEFEGQVPRLVAYPDLLELLADTYLAQHPDADLVSVAIIVRRFELDDGVRTGNFTDDVLITHQLPGARRGSA